MTKATFKRGGALVLPTISLKNMKEGDSLFIEVIGDSFRTVNDTDDKGETRMENGAPVQLHLLHVVDLSTGLEGEIVTPYMVKKGLDAVGNFAGKKFEIVKGEKKNRTIMWTVYGEAA